MAQTPAIADTRPPWSLYPGEPPVSGQFRQGNGEFYMRHVWLPFWRGLDAMQREEYFRHWNAPEDWRDYYRRDGTADQGMEEEDA